MERRTGRCEVDDGVDGSSSPSEVFECWIDTLEEGKAETPTSERE